MADDPSLTIRVVDRHCYDTVCHCDWRLSIQNCEESVAMWYVNVVNIAISALTAIVGLLLLIHRIFIKGHSIWNLKSRTGGWLRPKPVDSMLVFFIFFNSLRLLSSIVLLADLAPGNWIARSYIFEVPWDFGIGGITIYLIGIAQTISQSSSVSGWLPSPLVVDIVGSAALILPFISSLAITITAGALAEVNLPVSEVMIRLTYVAWFLWTAMIGSAVFYAGYRLVHILHAHHKKSRNDPHYHAVKAGIYKIQMMVATFVICLYGFATFLLLYAILRDPIMTNTAVNVALSVPWTFLGGVTTLIAQVSVIVSPKVRNNAALRSKTGNSNGGTTTGSTTMPDQNLQGGSTIGAVTTTFQNDNDAIFNAIKENDQQWIPHDQARKSKKYEPHFFINRMSGRRPSNASSQLELTSYNR